MSLPGWYPDPSGQPGTFRHWDGSSWSQQTTTDPRMPPPPRTPPSNLPPAGSGGAPKKGVLGWVLGGVALALALAAVIAHAVFSRNNSAPPSVTPAATAPATTAPATTAPATTAPTNAPTPGAPTGGAPTGGAQLNCAAGAGKNLRGSSPTRGAAGLQYDAVPGWTWSFSSEMFPWLDEMTAYGEVKKYNNNALGAGIAIGSVSKQNGFTDPAQAVAQVYECIQRYGVGADGGYDWPALGGVEQTTIGGMPAWRAKVLVGVQGAPQKLDMVIAVVDSGLGTGYAMVNTFVPDDDTETAQKIDRAMATMRRG